MGGDMGKFAFQYSLKSSTFIGIDSCLSVNIHHNLDFRSTTVICQKAA